MVFNIIGAESFRRALARCAAKAVVSAIRRSTPSISNSHQHKYTIMVLTGGAALFKEVDMCYVSECNFVRGLARQRGVDSWHPRNLVSVRRFFLHEDGPRFGGQFAEFTLDISFYERRV